MENLQITHYVTSVVRAETNSGNDPTRQKRPMWRCETSSGDRFNIFLHDDPHKNSYALFDQAGYGVDLLGMQVGERQDWLRSPIAVSLQKQPPDNKWWEVICVATRPDGAAPDSAFAPDENALYSFRFRAIFESHHILHKLEGVRVFDLETTSQYPALAEITEVAILDGFGDTAFATLLKPADVEAIRRAAAITGITPEMVVESRGFPMVYDALMSYLYDKTWCVYNAGYDPAVIAWECARIGKPIISPRRVIDVMQMYADFAGQWDHSKRGFRWFKLVGACEREGITLDGAHRALNDAQATYKLIERMAKADA
jgi:hypothetical protein